MIYIFDKKQAIIKVLTNDDFTAAHLNFKINTATTFEFSLPASKALPSGSKYVATHHPLNDSKFIMLRLTERVDNTETIDYSAYELAYQELATDGYIEDKRPQNQSALNLMKIALDGSNWELNNVNVSGTATTNFYYVNRLSAISSVVDLLGGEIVFYIEIQGNAISGRYMDYLARQGADTSKVFASGSNLLTVERQSDTSNIYTAILPRGKGEEIDNGEADTPDGYGRRINIADVEWKKSAGKPLDKPKGSIVLSDPDATAEWGQINGNARLLLQTYDDIDDVNVLINSAYKTLQSVNHPQIQYSATVADVGGLSLGDTVLIMHGDRDLSYKTRVFEVKYDLLSPDQTELSLGDDLSSNSITSQLNNLNAVADATSSQTQWTINQIGRPGTTYGATAPDSPKVGDIWFKYLPDGGTEIYRWNGDIWELLASPTTADDIATAVDDAVSQAKSHTDEVKQGLSSDIATAKSQAASLASTAEANAKSEATSLFNRAQNALSDAKTDLTKSISSEASKAVASANSQAQNYVNQAKSDINDTINAFSVGGRNYVLNSNVSATSEKLWFYSSVPSSYFNNKKLTVSVQLDYDNITALSDKQRLGVEFLILNKDGSNRFVGSWKYPAIGDSFHGRIYTTWDFSNNEFKDYATNQMGNGIYVQGVTGTNVSVSKPKLEIGNKPTDWTQAPEDIVLDYTTKDNKIKETISQYQETNDGYVSKAQTDATTALGLVETKVSKTVYDQKTGELSSNINDVKDTADTSAQTIADIQEADGKQDARMSEIEKTAEGITSTVSDLSTAQEKQSGYISTLKQRADGFDATVTKVNNLSVGGRNLIVRTGELVGQMIGSDGKLAPFDKSAVTPAIITVTPGESLTMSGTVGSDYTFRYAFYDGAGETLMRSYSDLKPVTTVIAPAEAATFRISYLKEAQVKLERGNIATDWTPAPEDLSSATAKAQLTADEASAAVTKLTNADGIITKAQADIRANADAITKTVSKTVYDQNNNTLNQAISKAQSTADGAVSTVGNYQTSNDKRVGDAESKIEQHSKDITARVIQTDYDKKTGELSGYISTLKQRADGFDATVTKVDNLSVGGRNYILNSERALSASGNSSDTSWAYTPMPVSAFSNKTFTISVQVDYDNVTEVTGSKRMGFELSANYTLPDGSKEPRYFGMWRKVAVGESFHGRIYSTYDMSGAVLSSLYTPNLWGNGLYIQGVTGTNVSVSNPKMEMGNAATDWSPAPEDATTALAQVKVTADGVSKFVRDSSGNISSDFQTALSRTSIITGSTLASSIKTQTSSQISSAITDNNGKIISLINQDTSGVQIAGKNITLDGNTTVTGDFYAKGGNFKNLNASNLTVGTLNGNQVNITNINANNIVSGAISGANLNINLNTGSVVFQKGRINSSDYTTDINIDQGYISTANGDTRAILKNGQLQLTSPDYYDLQTNPYLSISNDPRTLESGGVMYGAVISARDRVVIGNKDGINSMLNDRFYLGQSNFYGLSSGKTIGSNTPTVVGGGATGVVLVGGSTYTNTIGGNDSPSIIVGWTPYGNGFAGNRVRIDANYFQVGAVYDKTSSASSNVVVNADGALVRSSSARKYKLDIKNNIPIDDSLKLIDVPLSTWVDKHEHEENGSNERYFGMIAEDLRDAGLEYLVQYGNDNEVEGINYDRVALLLIPLVKELKERIEELESKGK